MKTYLLPLVCLCILTSTAVSQVNVADSMALVAIYNATNGPKWTKQENWLTGPVSTWQGITVKGERVTEVNFTLAGLQGEIPESLFSLDSLKSFNIRENNAVLNCDSRMQQWTRIQKVSVSGSMLSGEINALCDLPHLTEVTFFNMDLGGVIPSCLQNMALTRLHFSNVGLGSTTLPKFLGDIPTLDILTLEGNAYVGPIPNSYCTSSIRFLNLKNNSLTGEIPDCLNADDQLIQLFLGENALEGTVPLSVLGTHINILDLSGNVLTGNMDDWPPLNTCIRLELDNNAFEGTFNGAILQSTSFRILNISNNSFNSVSSFDTFPLINTLLVHGNSFDFAALQTFVPGNANFTYAPQATIDTASTVELPEGGGLSLSMNVGGTITTYQWYKDGGVIDKATGATYEITDGTIEDTGVYHCEAQHDGFPGLTLVRAPVEVQLGISALRDIYSSEWELKTNPVSSYALLDRLTQSVTHEEVTLSIVNIQGQILGMWRLRGDQNQMRIDVATLPSGMYIINMRSAEGIGVWRLIKR